MVALGVYYWRYRDVFYRPQLFQHYQSTSHPPGQLIPWWRVHQPRCGFSLRMVLLLDYLLFPTLVCRPGGVAVHAKYFRQIPIWYAR